MSGTAMQAPGALGQMRPLGSTGVQVSAVGLGTWAMGGPVGRSEERRVGKECRSRWSPYH